ncbi:fimbrial assembly protein [Sporosarcina sp. P13]|uniref:PilN domain-containing protein n=1 Tax=Sporosarcina sp. P13 TaxID=2048263 RepID=UPI000C16703D|nr:fimbrial assembly protein [Sporosarcina sp. P13]PIC63853.1 fimbrial assembly protein [Sporosarcina sp. P13]
MQKLVDINLLPEKIRERTTWLWIVLAIFVAALISWAILSWMAQKNEDEARLLKQQTYEVQKQQEAITSQLRPSAFGQEKADLASTVEFLEGYQYKTHPLIKDLVKALPERGFFMELTFTAPNEVMLNVQFDDMTEPAHYLTRIKSSSLVIDATFEGVEAKELGANESKQEGRQSVLPRYEAKYFIQFVDERGVTPPNATADPNADSEPQLPADMNTEGGGTNG